MTIEHAIEIAKKLENNFERNVKIWEIDNAEFAAEFRENAEAMRGLIELAKVVLKTGTGELTRGNTQ